MQIKPFIQIAPWYIRNFHLLPKRLTTPGLPIIYGWLFWFITFDERCRRSDGSLDICADSNPFSGRGHPWTGCRVRLVRDVLLPKSTPAYKIFRSARTPMGLLNKGWAGRVYCNGGWPGTLFVMGFDGGRLDVAVKECDLEKVDSWGWPEKWPKL